jgi:hypothetical protein
VLSSSDQARCPWFNRLQARQVGHDWQHQGTFSGTCLIDPAAHLSQKIRDRQLAAPVDSETLQDLVRNELATKKHTATEGLVWLNR